MPATRAWNEASPAGTDLVSSLDNRVRDILVDIRERMELEHQWNDSQADDGKHLNITIAGTANKSLINGSGYSLTGSNSQSGLEIAGTWDTSGTPTLIKGNVTDTNSNASSLLLDLLVASVSKFKVAKSGALTAAGLEVVNSSGIIAALKKIAAKSATTDLNNTTTETSVLSVTVPGGTLSTSNALYFALVGSFENDTGATRTTTMRVKYGGTTIFTGVISFSSAFVDRSALLVDVWLNAHGATNAQTLRAEARLGINSGSVDGGDFLSADAGHRVGFARNIAIDSSVNQTFEITFQNSDADFFVRLDSGPLIATRG